MSIKIMAAVYESDLTDIYEVSVMLALANHADDEGRCYPSTFKIAKLARCSERKVQGIAKALADRGYLHIEMNAGPRGCNVFHITPNPRTLCAPARHAPPHAVQEPPHATSKTPAQRAPEPSRTIKEPSVVKSADQIADVLGQWAGREAVASFIAYRRKAKGKAVTLTAAKRLANHLKAIFNRGGDPDDALGLAEERGWQTVEADWYFNAKGQGNGPKPKSGRAEFDRAIGEVAAGLSAGTIAIDTASRDPFARRAG